MAAVLSQNPDINFDMRLYKNIDSIAETGIYDVDVIDSGVLFHKGRVIDFDAHFQFCIVSHSTNRIIMPKRIQWGFTRYKTGDWWLTDPGNSVAPTINEDL